MGLGKLVWIRKGCGQTRYFSKNSGEITQTGKAGNSGAFEIRDILEYAWDDQKGSKIKIPRVAIDEYFLTKTGVIAIHGLQKADTRRGKSVGVVRGRQGGRVVCVVDDGRSGAKNDWL